MTSRTEAAFIEYFVKNYPPNTVITDPYWHATRIFRAIGTAVDTEAAREEQLGRGL